MTTVRTAKTTLTKIRQRMFGQIAIDGEVDADMAERVLDQLDRAGDDAHVVLSINSDGGNFEAGRAIATALMERSGRSHARVVDRGMGASAAALIWLSATTRHIGTGARIMLHLPAGNLPGGRLIANILQAHATACADAEKWCVNLIVSRANMSAAEAKALLAAGQEMDSRTAIRCGLLRPFEANRQSSTPGWTPAWAVAALAAAPHGAVLGMPFEVFKAWAEARR